jgi:hypothetical protein
MEKKKIKHKHEDGIEHAHVDGDKPHTHEITKQTVQVKPKSEIVVQRHGITYKVDEQLEDFNKKVTKEYNDTIKRAGSVRENIEKRAGSVYTASYKLIDETIEDIKKMSRKVSTNDYSANNVYLILQDALKKVRLAEA